MDKVALPLLTLIVFSFAILDSSAVAPKPTVAPYMELCPVGIEAVDGDTVNVTATFTLVLRLNGIDTPELRDPFQKRAAEVARNGLAEWLTNTKNKAVRLEGLGMYGRMVGDVVNPITGESLSGYMLGQGLAVPYKNKRHEWTRAELDTIESKKQVP